MGKKNDKKLRIEGEQDKVLRIAVAVVIVLLLIGAIIVTVRILNPRADIKAGTKMLSQMKTAEVSQIDAKIIELEKAEKEADEVWKNRTLNEKFANSMILGDSIAQGIYEFELLDASLVGATKGADMYTSDVSGSKDDLAKAESVKPQNLFLAYGMNDVKGTNANATLFRESYLKFITEIKKILPDTKIYINSVLPVQALAIEKTPAYSGIGAFNEQLKSICEEEGIGYVDHTESVKEEFYESDGIHLKPEFYPIWLNSMAEAAGI